MFINLLFLTLLKTMDFSPKLSVATYFCHSHKGGNPGVTKGYGFLLSRG